MTSLMEVTPAARNSRNLAGLRIGRDAQRYDVASLWQHPS